MSRRIVQVNEEFRRRLGEILNRDVDIPLGSMVTITGVKTSPDLRYATVFFTSLPESAEQEMLGFLQREAKRLRAELAKSWEMRFIPQITFALDEGQIRARRIHDLLSQDEQEE